MGRGRATAVAIAGLVGATALFGCGESRHGNDQRPQVSTRVSVTINPGEVIVQPLQIGMGPEKFQRIPQNQDHAEPPLKNSEGPLDVTFVTANQTPTNARLKITGTKDATSETVFARSPSQFQVDLPAGSYTISAVGMPEVKPAQLEVGNFRGSSQNDVLLP